MSSSAAVSEHLQVLAVEVPRILPNFSFPGMSYVLLGVAMVMGVVVLLLIALFFVGLFRLVASFSSKKEGGAGGAAATMVASAVGIAIISTGTVFLNSWVNFFGA